MSQKCRICYENVSLPFFEFVVPHYHFAQCQHVEVAQLKGARSKQNENILKKL